MLATIADLYRQEVGAEEDVHRTLPFFGTALGIIIGALAYAAGRLPKWSDLTAHRGMIAFAAATVLLGLAVIEAGCVLVFISRAIARRDYRRIGPETACEGHAAGPSGLLYNRHSYQPRREPKALQVPGAGFVAPRSQLDMGTWGDHCDIRDRQAGLSP
jgi:hypothetical protein